MKRRLEYPSLFLFFVALMLYTMICAVAFDNSSIIWNEANVLQAYVTERVITVFSDKELRSDELVLSVSNQNMIIERTGSLSDGSALTKTTLLLDISGSMPNATRNAVIATLRSLIENKSSNEEYRLVVFANEIVTLQDFTVDRYDLATALDKIAFNGTQSRIYDAIDSTIPVVAWLDDKPVFYRTIVITDGIEVADTGITREELLIRLQNERYPVDVVAVSRNETAENRDLSAIMRVSGGRYFALIQNTDTAALAQTLGASGNFYIEAMLPTALLDGTTRQVDIYDGQYGLSMDVKFPIYQASNMQMDETETPQPEPQEEQSIADATPEAPPAQELTISPLPQMPQETRAPFSFAKIFGEQTVQILIGAGFMLVIIAVFFLTTNARKKKMQIGSLPTAAKGDASHSNDTETKLISDNDMGAHYTVKLSVLSNSGAPGKSWILPLEKDLLIGRAENCKIQLTDESVSREHCKIMVQGTDVVLVHLSQTNETSLNGGNIDRNAPLKDGDILKIGRSELRIDNIQSMGNMTAPVQQKSPSSGKTEMIF